MSQVFNQDLIIKFEKKTLDRFLTCSLCDGYFRFAHTVSECGDTFCKLCIVKHLKKSKTYCCPKCQIPIETNYQKSIKKDPYKQSLVDLLYPQFQQKDQLVVRKIKELFPAIDLTDLQEDFQFQNKYFNYWQKKKIKQNQYQNNNNGQSTNLQEIVTNKLNLEIDSFLEDILNEKKFVEIQQKLQLIEQQKNQPQQAKQLQQQQQGQQHKQQEQQQQANNNDKIVIEEKDELFYFQLHPKTEQDFAVVQLKNSLKSRSVPGHCITIEQIKRFLLKRILELANQPDQTKLVNLDEVQLEKIILSYNGIELKDMNQSIVEFKQQQPDIDSQFTLIYEILFKTI